MEAEAEDHVRTSGTLVLLSRWTQGARYSSRPAIPAGLIRQ